MTKEEVMALAKEKFGKELNEEQAEAYLAGSMEIPDEMLDDISGGSSCDSSSGSSSNTCPWCGSALNHGGGDGRTPGDSGYSYCSNPSCSYDSRYNG